LTKAQPATIVRSSAAQTAEFRLSLGIYKGGGSIVSAASETMGQTMRDTITFAVFLFLALLLGAVAPADAQPDEKRIALVVGNADYSAGKLQTPANDAGLIAQTLQAAGFDVVGARDLDQESLRRSFKDFLEKASTSGPNTIAFIYLSGYGLQLEGENYFVPTDAKIDRDLDVPTQAVRLTDYTRPLNTLNLKATIVVLDAARQHPFAKSGTPLASGLALVEPQPNAMVAFSAAPGTIAPEAKQGSYGPYAQALTEMIREGGLKLEDLFEKVRLRVNEATKGAQVPWNASNIEVSFVFFERSADAPVETATEEKQEKPPSISDEPIAELGPQQAYIAAVNRDTIEAYQEFITAYPENPLAKRARALVAARREAVTWRRSRTADTPAAYWSYLKRYPKGPHAADCRRRLAYLTAELEAPETFDEIEYDVPPPPPEEIVYVERPVIVFDDPEFDFVPPPPAPVFWLPPPPIYIVTLPPPPPPIAVFVLPAPIFVPIPVYVRPPIYVIPPPRNVYFENIHNEIVFNNVTNVVIIKDRHGKTRKYEHWRDDRRKDDRAIAYAPSLPPSVEKRAGGLRPDSRSARQDQFDELRKRGRDGGRENRQELPDRDHARERFKQGKTEEFQSRDRLNRMRSEARRQRLKERTANRGEDALQRDQLLDENGRQQGRGERYKRRRDRDEARQQQFLDDGGQQGSSERYRRKRDRGEQQFQPRRRNRDYDMAEEQGFEQPGGRRSRGELRRAERREFRRSQEMGGEPQDDRRGRKRGRKSDEGCERSEGGCGD
jgi:uncharacterized caspase-like protein